MPQYPHETTLTPHLNSTNYTKTTVAQYWAMKTQIIELIDILVNSRLQVWVPWSALGKQTCSTRPDISTSLRLCVFFLTEMRLYVSQWVLNWNEIICITWVNGNRLLPYSGLIVWALVDLQHMKSFMRIYEETRTLSMLQEHEQGQGGTKDA